MSAAGNVQRRAQSARQLVAASGASPVIARSETLPLGSIVNSSTAVPATRCDGGSRSQQYATSSWRIFATAATCASVSDFVAFATVAVLRQLLLVVAPVQVVVGAQLGR